MYVAVEGIIGGGKSTFAARMAETCGWRLLEEPVEGNPLLPLFYQDQKRWAFALQTWFLHARYRLQQVAAHDFQTCVLDRSLPGDLCFARLQRSYGNMAEPEWQTYLSCYDSMCAVRPPMLMLFLDVDPKVALERVRRRNRGMETGITLGYLEDLTAEYRRMVDDIRSGTHHWSRGITVWTIPWSAEMVDPGPAVDEWVVQVREFLKGRR